MNIKVRNINKIAELRDIQKKVNQINQIKKKMIESQEVKTYIKKIKSNYDVRI